MLKISASGEGALLLTKYLIKNPGLHTLTDVAIALHAKEPFLRKIANKLEKSGIISSKKGRNGGIEIAKSEISVYDVLSSVDEDLFITVCSSKKDCALSHDCGISPTVFNIQRGFDTILKITKL